MKRRVGKRVEYHKGGLGGVERSIRGLLFVRDGKWLNKHLRRGLQPLLIVGELPAGGKI